MQHVGDPVLSFRWVPAPAHLIQTISLSSSSLITNHLNQVCWRRDFNWSDFFLLLLYGPSKLNEFPFWGSTEYGWSCSSLRIDQCVNDVSLELNIVRSRPGSYSIKMHPAMRIRDMTSGFSDHCGPDSPADGTSCICHHHLPPQNARSSPTTIINLLHCHMCVQYAYLERKKCRDKIVQRHCIGEIYVRQFSFIFQQTNTKKLKSA